MIKPTAPVAKLIIPPGKVLHALSGRPLTNKEVRDMLGYPPGAVAPYRDQDVGKVFTVLFKLLIKEGKVESAKIGTVHKYRLTETGKTALQEYLETQKVKT